MEVLIPDLFKLNRCDISREVIIFSNENRITGSSTGYSCTGHYNHFHITFSKVHEVVFFVVIYKIIWRLTGRLEDSIYNKYNCKNKQMNDIYCAILTGRGQ